MQKLSIVENLHLKEEEKKEIRETLKVEIQQQKKLIHQKVD